MQLTQITTLGIVLGIALLNPAFGHNLEAEIEVESIQFKVRAFFEDGTPTGNAATEIIASDGNVLTSGKTDEKGEFVFSHDLKEKIEVTVEDDTGHREVFPLSAAAIALAIKGEAAELEHTHGEGDHDHDHEHGDDGGHDHGDEEGEHSHDDEDPSDPGETGGIVLAKEGSGSQTQKIISGLGYVLGITGILFYLLGMKQKAGA